MRVLQFSVGCLTNQNRAETYRYMNQGDHWHLLLHYPAGLWNSNIIMQPSMVSRGKLQALLICQITPKIGQTQIYALAWKRVLPIAYSHCCPAAVQQNECSDLVNLRAWGRIKVVKWDCSNGLAIVNASFCFVTIWGARYKYEMQNKSEYNAIFFVFFEAFLAHISTLCILATLDE